MTQLKLTLYLLFVFEFAAHGEERFQKTTVYEHTTCIYSNGVPDHEIGKFPNEANPNELRKQDLTFCFPRFPRLTENVTWGLMTVGVSTKGIAFRPYTAEYFDPNTRKGFSKNPSSGWRKQAMYDPAKLGIDANNGHVDRSGLYHYHRIAEVSNEFEHDKLIGFAPDGFQIFYSRKYIKSSWKLKSGMRSYPPGGSHTGQFEEDFEYVSQNGELDECNGKKVNGVYTYFATDTYPFVPRCFKGKINPNFMVRN